MFCSPEVRQRARKAHRCTGCLHSIAAGEEYVRWVSIDDKPFTNKMHLECIQALHIAADGYSFEYMPGELEPPERLKHNKSC